jgi:hypothetical protein
LNRGLKPGGTTLQPHSTSTPADFKSLIVGRR